MALPYTGDQNREVQVLRAQVGAVEDAERSARHSARLARLQKRLIVSERSKLFRENEAANLMQQVVEMRLAHGGAQPIVVAVAPVG